MAGDADAQAEHPAGDDEGASDVPEQEHGAHDDDSRARERGQDAGDGHARTVTVPVAFIVCSGQ